MNSKIRFEKRLPTSLSHKKENSQMKRSLPDISVYDIKVYVKSIYIDFFLCILTFVLFVFKQLRRNF